MSVALLPFELLDAVCQDVLPSDLASLARTTSALTAVAQRRLYRRVSVSEWAKNLSMVDTLANQPGIARQVRSFSITLAGDCAALQSFHHALARALSNMPELIELELNVDSGASWVLGLPSASRNTCYRRLERFTTSFALDPYVVGFLERTPALLELGVDAAPEHDASFVSSLSPTAIPNLASIVGSTNTARAIVPGRPLQKIHLLAVDVTSADVHCLSKSVAPITILDVTSKSEPIELLRTLASTAPSVVHLRMMYDFIDAPSLDFYEEVAQALGGFLKLKSFELSGQPWSLVKAGHGKEKVWHSRSWTGTFHREVDHSINSDFFLA